MRGASLLAPPALILAALALASCGPSAPPGSVHAPCASAAETPARRAPPGPIHHVVLVTMDGMMPDAYLHPDAHGLKVPTLRSLVARGASSDGALSVFPSVTYPSHTSMVTGVSPGQHGINGNRSFDPLEDDLEGWRWYAEDIKRDPIWRLAERAGYTVGLVHWPVSVGARVTWIVPEYWRAKNENDKKLVRALATPGLLESVAAEHPDFWPRYNPPADKDDALTDIALHILTTGKPTLLQLHLVEVDGAQHHFGIWTPEANAAIEKDDAQLARILGAIDAAGLSKDTCVLVASDHGFMNADKMVRPGVLLHDAGLVTTNPAGRVTGWKATLVVNSGQAYVYLKDPADTATRDAVAKILATAAAQASSGVGRVYSPADVRAAGGDPAAAFAIEPTSGYQFGPGYTGEYATTPTYRATHGFDPNRPEMRASLLMLGPTIPHGTIEGARLVDVGPTIASLLGIAMPDVEGKPLKVVAKP